MEKYSNYEEWYDALCEALLAHKNVDVYSYIGDEDECTYQKTSDDKNVVRFDVNHTYDCIKKAQIQIMYDLHDGEFDFYSDEDEELMFDANDDINVVLTYHWQEEFLYEHLCIFWNSNSMY